MKVLVINKSLGEIDWIAVNSNHRVFANIDLIILYRVSLEELYKYFPNFDKKFPGVKVLSFNNFGSVSKNIIVIDNLLDKVSTKIFNVFGAKTQIFAEFLLTFFRRFVSKFFSSIYLDKIVLLHEYNARTNILIELFKNKNDVILFPHHFGYMHQLDYFQKRLCRFMYGRYCDKLLYSNDDTKFSIEFDQVDPDSKIALILTRQCSLVYGFDYIAAYESLDILCQKLNDLNYEIYIKHHPRENFYDCWNALELKHNITRLNYSVFDFCSLNLPICFHLFTTMVVPLSRMGVNCYDVSPYDDDVFNNNSIYAEQINKLIDNNYTKRLNVTELESTLCT